MVSIIFEVAAIICWLRLQTLRDRAVIKRCQKAFRTKENDIDKLKEMWLGYTFNAPRTAYLKIAEEIDKIITLQEKYRPSLDINKKNLAELIFSSDSKNRTLAMLIALCAGTIALSIAGGARIDDIFIFFEGKDFLELLLTTITISAFIIFLFAILRYLLLVLLLPLEAFFYSPKNTNPKRAGILIKQLIKSHQFQKAHIKINNTKITILNSSSERLTNVP
ncbi:hypothetical protein R9X34_01415 [Pseudomonas sp. 2023EL-01195]|uniref:hypothetical protein n=2 Tax=unclassified Pseudomonas TaxID=196821 RepID=UPI0013145CAD|nr:hypothetical protein [Pseudomonas sp. 57B-090624]MDW3710614.1 hypothetical protein [Pseudomonas sp. 2023EL-01195]